MIWQVFFRCFELFWNSLTFPAAHSSMMLNPPNLCICSRCAFSNDVKTPKSPYMFLLCILQQCCNTLVSLWFLYWFHHIWAFVLPSGFHSLSGFGFLSGFSSISGFLSLLGFGSSFKLLRKYRAS